MTKIQQVKLSDIIPDKSNANRHTERGEKMIRESIAKYGFAEAGTLDRNNRIIGGNLRTEASADLDMNDVIIIDVEGDKPVYIRRTDLDLASENDPRARELAYALNRVAQVSIDFNPEQVLADINAGVDFEGLFSQDDLNDILKDILQDPKEETQPPPIDKAAELAEKWGTALGQVWQLGDHRLAVGDCTEKDTIEKVLNGEIAELMFADPPYGVNYTGGHFHSGDVNIKRERPKLANDNNTDIYGAFLPVVLPYIDGPCYVWFASSVGKPVYDAIINNGCTIHAMIIWNKINATYAALNAQYKQRHEPCMYFKPKNSSLHWCGATDEATIWDEKRDPSNNYHPTQKPLSLPLRAIKNHTSNIILDPFLGSGTTLIGCEQLNRQCRGIEIDPGYAAVTLQRWADYTGKEPELLSE